VLIYFHFKNILPLAEQSGSSPVLKTGHVSSVMVVQIRPTALEFKKTLHKKLLKPVQTVIKERLNYGNIGTLGEPYFLNST